MIITGTAGWSIPRACAEALPGSGTHLQRYAAMLRGVEINTPFYRAHSAASYARWAGQTPRPFRFAVKLPREITHDQRLRAARRPLDEFLRQLTGLGPKLGPLLVQLPPSLPFESRVARAFFALMRGRHDGHVVCEPRHASWFGRAAQELLERHRIGRVAADPAVVPEAALPGGWSGIIYYRLHGSPRKYWSVYDRQRLAQLARILATVPRGITAWCVFDNTASGGAMANSLQLQTMLAGTSRSAARARKRPGTATRKAR